LQPEQASAKLSSVSEPPLEIGTICSTVKTPAE
jgi:hypothetical protein